MFNLGKRDDKEKNLVQLRKRLTELEKELRELQRAQREYQIDKYKQSVLPKWEYRVIGDKDMDKPDLSSTLENWGNHGWELAAIRPMGMFGGQAGLAICITNLHD